LFDNLYFEDNYAECNGSDITFSDNGFKANKNSIKNSVSKSDANSILIFTKTEVDRDSGFGQHVENTISGLDRTYLFAAIGDFTYKSFIDVTEDGLDSVYCYRYSNPFNCRSVTFSSRFKGYSDKLLKVFVALGRYFDSYVEVEDVTLEVRGNSSGSIKPEIIISYRDNPNYNAAYNCKSGNLYLYDLCFIISYFSSYKDIEVLKTFITFGSSDGILKIEGCVISSFGSFGEIHKQSLIIVSGAGSEVKISDVLFSDLALSNSASVLKLENNIKSALVENSKFESIYSESPVSCICAYINEGEVSIKGTSISSCTGTGIIFN
jgi:hypothetical protein